MDQHESTETRTDASTSPQPPTASVVAPNSNQEDITSMDGTGTPGTTTLFLDLYPGCDVCGRDHLTEECPELGLNTSTGEFKVMSKARLTLPSNLVLLEHMDSSLTVVTQQVIPNKTQFGPFEARRTTQDLDAENIFNLKILAKDGTAVCLDTSNENDCNWMCLVQCAENEEEQNCIAYQMGTNIFYSTIKNILQGEQLKVWYASYYAKKLGRPVKPTKNYNVMLSAERSKRQEVGVEVPILQHQPATESSVDSDDTLSAMSDPDKLYRKRIMSLIQGDEAKEYKCSRCEEIFNNQVDLAKHLRAHLVPSCTSRTNKVRMHKSRFQCSVCNIGFVNKSNYQRHTRRHKGQVLRCLECSYRSYRLDVMWNHLLSKHSKMKMQTADEKNQLFEYEDHIPEESGDQSLNQEIAEEEEDEEEEEEDGKRGSTSDHVATFSEASQPHDGLSDPCHEEANAGTTLVSEEVVLDSSAKESIHNDMCNLTTPTDNQALVAEKTFVEADKNVGLVKSAFQNLGEKPDITKIALMEAKITLEDGELDFKEKGEEQDMNESSVSESFEGFTEAYIKESAIGEFIHSGNGTSLGRNVEVPVSTTTVQIVQVSEGQSHESISEIYNTMIKGQQEEGSEKQILTEVDKCDNYLVRAVESIEMSGSLEAANVVCQTVGVNGSSVLNQQTGTFESASVSEESVITGAIIENASQAQVASGYIVEESVVTGEVIGQQALVVSESVVTTEAIGPTIVSQAVLRENMMCATAVHEVPSTPAVTYVASLNECSVIAAEDKCLEEGFGNTANLMPVEEAKDKCMSTDVTSTVENADYVETPVSCEQESFENNEANKVTTLDQDQPNKLIEFVDYVADVIRKNEETEAQNQIEETVTGKDTNEEEANIACAAVPSENNKVPIAENEEKGEELNRQETSSAKVEEPKKRRPGRPRKRPRQGLPVGRKRISSADAEKTREPEKKKSKGSPQRPAVSAPASVMSPARVLPTRRLKGIRTTGNKAVEADEEKEKSKMKNEILKPKKIVTEILKPGMPRRRGRPPKIFKISPAPLATGANNTSDNSSLQSASRPAALSTGLKTKAGGQPLSLVGTRFKRKQESEVAATKTDKKSDGETLQKSTDPGKADEACEIREKGEVEDKEDEERNFEESGEEIEENDDSNLDGKDDDFHPDIDMLIDKTEDGILYACCVCGKRFTNIKYLKLHAPAHTDRFRCEMCGKRFTRKESLMKHRCDSGFTSTILQTVDDDKVNFTCGECGKTFTRPEYAKRHFAMHTDIWKCEKCCRQFSRRHLLASHVCNSTEEEESKNSLHQCDICEQSFRTVKYLYRHLAMHTDIFKCDQCGRCFSRKDSLQKHILRCDPKRAAAENIHSCHNCGRTFSTKLGLENHLLHCFSLQCYKCRRSFATKSDLKDHECVPLSEESAKEGENRLSCQVCNKSFANPQYLNRHEATHKGTFQCDICLKGFSRNEELSWHKRLCMGEAMINRDGFVTCEKCGNKFQDAKDYRDHYQHHTHPFDCMRCGKRFVKRGTLQTHSCHRLLEGDEARCEICYKTFRSDKYLSRHQIIHGEPQFQCEVCHKKFYRKDYLNDHSCRLPDGTLVRVVRRQNQVFIRDNLICHLCGKSFVSVSNLNKHLKCHGEKTCECNICGKRFHYITYLKEHKAAVHENKYQHQCAECGKIVKTKTSLVSHMKQFHSETPPKYTCKTCGKVFRQKGNMKTHMFSHSQEKLFSCTYCGKKFKYPDQLNRHRLEHTMTNKLQCEHCGKKFVKGYELRKHIQIFHSGLMYMCDSCNAKCGHRHTLIRHYKRKHPEKLYLLRDPNFLVNLLKQVDRSQKDVVKSEPVPTAKNDETIITLGADTSIAVATAEALLPQMAAEALHSLSSTMFTTQGENIQVPEIHPAVVEEDGSHTVVILQFVNQEEGEEETVICRQEVTPQVAEGL